MSEENIIKISELDPVSDLYDGCCMPLVQMGETKKIEYATLKQKLNEDLDFVKDTSEIEERISTLEEDEVEQNQAIRDLRAGVIGKVDKVVGKGLSTNDFTNEDKDKVDEVDKLINVIPKETTTGTSSLTYNSKEYDLFKGEYGSNSYQKTTTGKNLINANLLTKGYKSNYGNVGVVPTIEADTKRITLTPENAVEVKPNTTYCFSVSANGWSYAIAQLKEDLTSKGDTGWKSSTNITITTDSDTKYIGLNARKTIDGTIVVITNEIFEEIKGSIQLEEGSTATSYEPYTNGATPNPDYPQEIEVFKGRNLLNESSIASGFVNTQGTINTQGTNFEGYSSFIKVKPNTKYTFKIFECSWDGFGNNNWIGVGEYSTNNFSSFIKRNTCTITTQDYITFTTSSTTNYIVVSARGLIKTNKSQVEENNATSYAPYHNIGIKRTDEYSKEQIYYIPIGDNELCKVGDVKDELVIENGRAKIIKKIGKIVLDGSESDWKQSGANNKVHNILVNNIKTPVNNDGIVNNIICSHFIANCSYNQIVHNSGFDNRTSVTHDKYLCFRYANTTSISAWQEWLSTHNITIYYELETPVEIDLGDINIKTLNGINNISLIATLEPSVISETHVAGLENEPLMQKSINIYECSSHRGYFAYSNVKIPENTIEAFKYAVNKGFDMIEVDVRLTSDNIPVICHDDTINRTARNSDGTTIGSNVYVGSSTFNTLNQYDYGIYVGPQFANTKLLTFDEVCRFAKYNNIRINIDTKANSNSQLLIIYNVIKKYGLQHLVRFTLSSKSLANYLLTLNPTLYIAIGAWQPSTQIVDDICDLKETYPNARIIGDFYVGLTTDNIHNYLIENDVEINYYVENDSQVIKAVNYGAIGFTINLQPPYDYLKNYYDTNLQ